MDEELQQSVIQHIKLAIKERVDKEFTEYKYKCLKELDESLEFNRGRLIGDVLDGIEVVVQNNQPYTLEPIIHVNVVKKVVIGDNK